MAASGKDGAAAVSTRLVDLSDAERRRIAERKATCPFVASAVETGALGVRNSADRPLAAVDDVESLGDSGGGDLGTRVLKLFARGNHSRMPGPTGELDIPTPAGMFSLDFAGSQGAHPGHSGILLGDPGQIDTGRFSPADFARLAGHADENGLLDTEAVGRFIAENLARDPAARILPLGRVARDLFGLADEIGDSLLARLTGRRTERDAVELLEKLTKLAGADNLIGSAGEFGLLFAFFANRPGADDEDRIPLAAVEEMMVRHRLPEGWESWPKRAADWVRVTTRIAASAARAHLKRP
jgi:hypothetical protein